VRPGDDRGGGPREIGMKAEPAGAVGSLDRVPDDPAAVDHLTRDAR
jgi:hypothetical protein